MVKPKKALGQHFLTDETIAKKIVDSLQTTSGNLLEIGPGKGVLSKYLIKNKSLNTFYIEMDTESVEYLNDLYPDIKENIIEGDFLKFPLQNLFGEESFNIIGNFPYNISSQIFFKVLEYKSQVTEVVGMIQKEVAERIAAPPGSKTYGILSVLLQAYYSIDYLFSVKEGVFFPPPKVKSAVIRLRRNETVALDCNEKLFTQVVKAGFNQRRKTLRNALKTFQMELNDEIVELLTKRAEQLSVQDFITLTKAIIV
jgi:16S rRNA (adenine1518-N6/adenine1519-N6)-dimethyltransferase